MKVKMNRDFTVEFYNYNGDAVHSIMTIKKGTSIDIDDGEAEVLENLLGCEYDRCYHITFRPYEYSENEVLIEVVNPSDDDENDPEVLRDIDCTFCLDADAVEEI